MSTTFTVSIPRKENGEIVETLQMSFMVPGDAEKYGEPTVSGPTLPMNGPDPGTPVDGEDCDELN